MRYVRAVISPAEGTVLRTDFGQDTVASGVSRLWKLTLCPQRRGISHGESPGGEVVRATAGALAIASEGVVHTDAYGPCGQCRFLCPNLFFLRLDEGQNWT